MPFQILAHRSLSKALIVLCISISASAVGAIWTSNAAIAETAWEASWISPVDSDVDRVNSWYCFYKQLDLETTDNFQMRVACDSKYWLWINGSLVVREGGLKRGPSPSGTYYDSVEIGKHLTTGTNHIAVLVWHFGKHGFSHNDSGKVGLICEGINSKSPSTVRLATDRTWKSIRHQAYQTAELPPANFRLPETNLRFDARKLMDGWQTGKKTEDWPAAVVNQDADRIWGELVSRPINQWRDSGPQDYVREIETEASQIHRHSPFTKDPIYSKEKRKAFIGVLPYNCHVHPIITLEAETSGSVIDIQTDNIRTGGEWLLRCQYVTKKGEQTFELPCWINGHEVRYLVPANVTVKSIGYRETGYDADFEGKFRCDNDRLNLLWKKSRRTLYVTMRDTYMDCPDRERAQWWGDVVNEIGEAFYIFDAKKGPQLARKAILELAAFQRTDGTLYSPVPAGVPDDKLPEKEQRGTWSKELPRQMLASVGLYGFWNYYLYTGDHSTIEEVYPTVKSYLNVWELDERGLAIHRTGQWDWTDWGKNIDVAVLENAWLHLAYQGAFKMAELLGEDADANHCRTQMDRIEASFNKEFWQGSFYRSHEHKGQTDDRANALAVVAGLASADYFPEITKFLQSNTHASPYMEKYVLEALYLMEQPDAAMERTLTRYEKMIDAPHSTLWENFARPDQQHQPGNGTYNHAWSGGPLTMMHQYIAGVAPLEPAFKRFSVRPQLGKLNRVELEVPTLAGSPIILKVEKTETGQSVDLSVPSGLTAEVEILDQTRVLKSGQHQWTVNKKTVEGNSK